MKRFALARLIGVGMRAASSGCCGSAISPKDVLVQQKQVARVEALALVAPVHFLSFPAILKGWLDRVWTPRFAYDLTEDAWRSDINGRRPRPRTGRH